MIFLNSKVLWFILLLPFVAFLLYLARVWKQKKISLVISQKFWKNLIPSSRESSYFIRSGLFLSGLFFLVITLARPISGFETIETKQKGVDIFVLIDTSASMDTQDVKPSRLEQAKREIIDLLDIIEGDRVGLIPFSGKAFLFCPLTSDYTSYKTFVDEIDSKLIPVSGSNLEEAIGLALASFAKEETHAKSILVITDGGETEGQLQKAIDAAKKENVRVDFLGVGDKMTGAPIPDQDGGYKKDIDGKLVISKLNEDLLIKWAQESGGIYKKSVPSDSDLKSVYFKGIRASLEQNELKSGQHKVPYEKYQIPLAMALFLLAIEFFLRESKKMVL